MKLESIGRFLAGGWGDRVAIGVFMRLWDNVTPARAYEYISQDLKLGYWVSDSDWKKYRRIAKSANIGDITRERVIAELEKHRPDILRVIIINQPESLDWLDRQVVELKEKLGLERE